MKPRTKALLTLVAFMKKPRIKALVALVVAIVVIGTFALAPGKILYNQSSLSSVWLLAKIVVSSIAIVTLRRQCVIIWQTRRDRKRTKLAIN